MLNRREAIRRASVVLGGIAFVGGDALLAACGRERPTGAVGDFTLDDIAFLDEVAETILPATTTPGAKAARTGAFMALMVTDVYQPADQTTFRDGMRALDRASQDMNGASFMAATPAQRLALLRRLDREQWIYSETRDAAQRRKRGEPNRPARQPEAWLPDQRREGAPVLDAGAAAAITADAPAHYFRMMKELTLLGYFTSEIGYTQAQRYMESPGRFEPCVDHAPGEKAWAPHA